jgi:hypothetical protein
MVSGSIITAIFSSAGTGTAIIVVLLLTGALHTKAAYEEIKSDRDREIAGRQAAEKQLAETQQVTNEKIVPLLTTFVTTTQALIPLLQEQVRQRQEDDPAARRRSSGSRS